MLRVSKPFWNVSGHFLAKQSIETGPGMLYMVGKIFLWGISFNLVYNESAHENMK